MGGTGSGRSSAACWPIFRTPTGSSPRSSCGEVLFLRWSASTPAHQVTDGIDTFVFRDGLISTQTVHYTLTDRTD